MKVDGRLIAQEIKLNLQKRISNLKKNNITPCLAVIIVGSDPASLAYVRQKKLTGEKLKIKVRIFRFKKNSPKNKIINLVRKLNKDDKIHGIIIQRPAEAEIKDTELNLLVQPKKDVDGLHPQSKFNPPIALAVWKILEFIYNNLKNRRKITNEDFINWLKKKKVTVIGRGETGGKPIINYFKRNKIPVTIGHSIIKNLAEITKNADIVISCVGKDDIVRHSMLNKNSILIGVGIHRKDDKPQADYHEAEISKITTYFTPVPGGVGPINVACLFENLINSI